MGKYDGNCKGCYHLVLDEEENTATCTKFNEVAFYYPELGTDLITHIEEGCYEL